MIRTLLIITAVLKLASAINIKDTKLNVTPEEHDRSPSHGPLKDKNHRPGYRYLQAYVNGLQGWLKQNAPRGQINPTRLQGLGQNAPRGQNSRTKMMG